MRSTRTTFDRLMFDDLICLWYLRYIDHFFSSVGGCMNVCKGSKAETTVPSVSWVFRVSFPELACRWKSHPLLWSEHLHHCLGKNSPFPFHHSCLPSLVLCDKATFCWPLHPSATLCEWESLCDCMFLSLSVWCCCYLCHCCMAVNHVKWLTVLVCFFGVFFWRCQCEVYVWCQLALSVLLNFDVLPWSQFEACDWVYTIFSEV